ncbi:hypothetical protein N474_15935 [Pseudoalteromonas luteoviolacea CPMOR-2]|uniref:TonB-dependent receptor plug domain-containing protein n=1 Tax=Pseudoalteromonas luteoviolacea TaxID=43657 RepID=UPI0007B05BD5|nr:TonB-dependent receptor [Pseudoalteromonas luteoviolacea]KZN55194.1 hypothetical protein N474_15935 [Pseudoalteromonas luteoviolacea CPMOR-2]
MKVLTPARVSNVLLPFISCMAFAQNEPQQSSDLSEQVGTDTETLIEESRYIDCDNESKRCRRDYIEQIEVRGDRPNPISISSEGAYTLDSQLLRDYRTGNGNLTDILGILPGVQYSEAMLGAEQLSNIRPAEVSLSGASGRESGYFIDGINNNSLLGNEQNNANRNYLQDVIGHSQETFVNLDLVDTIEVFDSNIPARYGQFSGGVVDADTVKAGDELQFGLSYRGTNKSAVEYERFYSPWFSGKDVLSEPDFKKQNIGAYVKAPINADTGLVAQFNLLESQESLFQLGRLRLQKQTNYNGFIKLDHALTANDDLTVSASYAPFKGQYFSENALNSDYTVDGGGYNFNVKWSALRSWGAMDSQLSWRASENNKDTAPYWFAWASLPGKSWGGELGYESSIEGGYGDIEKSQRTLSFSQDFEFDYGALLGSTLSWQAGFELKQQYARFNRLEEAIIYNGSVIRPSVNCSGYTIDCVETQYKVPVSALEAQLGRALDLTKPEDILLLNNNVLQSGQFFAQREVNPKGDASARINNLSAYLESQWQWQDLTITLGGRYDYNNFVKNHNFAPRFRGNWSVFSERGQWVFGANRYYSQDQLDYKLNEAKQPSHFELRHLQQGRLSQWVSSKVSRGFVYQYSNIRTPYTDELILAYRHQLLGGTLELKWLNRFGRDGINRVKGYNEIGQATLFAGNEGAYRYERLSASWMARFDNQHVEINLSKVSNEVAPASFDGDPAVKLGGNKIVANDAFESDELAFLAIDEMNLNGDLDTKYYLMSLKDIEFQKQDFNRPLIANISWGGHFGSWQLSMTARYSGAQDVLYKAPYTRSISSAAGICETCSPAQKAYSVYFERRRASVTTVNSNIKYKLLNTQQYQLNLSLEIENLFNQRTYTIAPLSTGLEVGRRFWLGVKLDL